MKLGAFDIYPVTDGRFRLGGAMFRLMKSMADDLPRLRGSARGVAAWLE